MLKKKFTVIVMTMLLILGMVSVAAAAEAVVPAQISVGGTGKATIAPDMAVISLGVISEGKNANVAQEDNKRITNAIVQGLTGMGIAKKDLQTAQYSFNPIYGQDSKKIAGYRVKNSLVVTVNDISKVGEVIDVAFANGANNINSLNFNAKHPEAMRRQALTYAIEDARTKAELIAGGLGVKLVGVQHVTENVGSLFEHSDLPENARLFKMSNDSATIINPGELELEATVQVDFLIQ